MAEKNHIFFNQFLSTIKARTEKYLEKFNAKLMIKEEEQSPGRKKLEAWVKRASMAEEEPPSKL